MFNPSAELPRRVSLGSSQSCGNDDTADDDRHGDEDSDQLAQQLIALSQELVPEHDVDEMIKELDAETELINAQIRATEEAEEKYKQQQLARQDDNFADIADDVLIRATDEAEMLHKQNIVQAQQQESQTTNKKHKINQYFLPRDTTSVPAPSGHKDTDECMYSRNRKKLYKKGETWKSSKMPGYLFTLQDLRVNPKTRRKEAKCLVLIEMWKTFVEELGGTQLAIWGDTSELLKDGHMKDGHIPLDVLTERVEGPVPQPSIIWEASRKKTKGVGYSFAYRFPKLDKYSPAPKRRPVVLDLFAGCGGMSLGFEFEDFHVKYKVENNPAAADTLELNADFLKKARSNEHTEVFREDVELFLEKCKSGKMMGLYPTKHDIDILHASPPCQGFSKASRFGGRNDDSNNAATSYFVQGVDLFRPRIAILENVMGMWQDKRKDQYLKNLMDDLVFGLGYQARFCSLSSLDFGDAQDRPRIFVMAARHDCKLPDLPVPTHGKEGTRPHVVVKDVLGILENTEPVFGSGKVQLPDGTVVRNHNAERTQLLEDEKEMTHLVAGRPAKTVLKQNPMKHYNKKLRRCLTIRERALLQSFPLDYKFCGKLSEQSNQIGNAVPVNLSRAVTRCIKKSCW